MSGYSEDLRTRIASAAESGMPKARAVRTFSVSLSSVKRYVNKASRGESLGSEEETRIRSEAGRSIAGARVNPPALRPREQTPAP